MMRLRWTRTILCALGFTWAMVQWHLHDRRQAHVAELIARFCARAEEKVSDVCEIGLRSRGLGSDVQVSGSVDVSGSIDVQ